MLESPRTKGWESEQCVLYMSAVRDSPQQLWYLRELTTLFISWERRVFEKAWGKDWALDKRKEQPFKGFVNINLNLDRKQAFHSWDLGEVELFTLLGEVVDDLYRVSFSSANDGNAVMCALTCRDTGSLNAGWCMTSRAPTWQEALRVALWKHMVLCDGDWSEYFEGDVDDSWG